MPGHLLPLCAGHIEAQLLDGRLLGIKLTHDLTFVHDQNAVGEVHDLFQLEADQQHGLALVAKLHQLAVDVFDRAHVQAARGLDGDDERLVAVDLAGDDSFLLVAAGHAAGNGHRPLAGAHVKLLDELFGIFSGLIKANEAMALELRLLKALQNEVLLQRKVQNQAMLVSILGNVAHARVAAVANGRVGDVVAAEGDLAAGGLFKPRQGVDQIGLAVAVDACDAYDLARARGERNVLHSVVLVQAGGHPQILHLEHGLGGPGGAFLHHQLHGAAHHHAAELLLRGGGGVHRTHVATLAQHRYAVGHLHDLIELVGDEQDALAFPGQPPHDFHQLLNLLRGEHGVGSSKMSTSLSR